MKNSSLTWGAFLAFTLSMLLVAPLKANGLKPWPLLLEPTQRFTLYGANQDVVYDRVTGLLWERSPSGTSNISWTNAVDGCISKVYPGDIFTIGSTGGWRLPTVEELTSLQKLVFYDDHGQGTDEYRYAPSSDLFENVDGLYWAFTTYPFSGVVSNPDQAYRVAFGTFSPALSPDLKTDSSAKRWCVYGGSNPVQFFHPAP
ncbi:MAG TPA: DUF1566 domain-containing protein [bacterium]|nr:DUF1566 domain-containing protein [bacterium]